MTTIEQADAIRQEVMARIITAYKHKIRRKLQKGSAFDFWATIGCDRPTLTRHVERHFRKGMDWGSYGEWNLRSDREFDEENVHDQQSFERAFHFKNYRP